MGYRLQEFGGYDIHELLDVLAEDLISVIQWSDIVMLPPWSRRLPDYAAIPISRSHATRYSCGLSPFTRLQCAHSSCTALPPQDVQVVARPDGLVGKVRRRHGPILARMHTPQCG